MVSTNASSDENEECFASDGMVDESDGLVETELAASFSGSPNSTNPNHTTDGGDADPSVVVYGSVPADVQKPSWLQRYVSSRSPKTLMWTVWFLLQFPFALLVLVPLADAFKSPVVMFLALAWLIPKWGLAMYATDWVLSVVLKSVQCPYCREEFETVGRWGCGCGYVDHKHQHCYRFRCPKCKGRLGYYSCRRCDATIILR